MQFHLLNVFGAILIACPVTALNLPGVAAEAWEAASEGKSRDITLASRTKVGDIALEPGVYRVHHTRQGETHLMHFKPVANPREEWTALVECDRDRSRRPWKHTDVILKKEGSTPRIVQIVLKGETVIYRFK